MSKPNKKPSTKDKKKKAKDSPEELPPTNPDGFDWSDSRELPNQSALELFSSPVKTTDVSQC